MKIGIVTVYDSANFGSYLQAYALNTALKELGHDVSFIKIRNDKVVKRIFMGRTENPIRFLTNYIYNSKKYSIFKEDLQYFNIVEVNNTTKDTFDCVIFGSDEIWNVNTPAFTNEYFYGKGILANKKITYAISCGNAKIEDLKAYPNLIDRIKQLDEILVRDENTKNNILNLIGKNCKTVCDPTFLIDVKKYEKQYDNPIKEKYLLVYTYYLDKSQIENIKKFAKERELKVVSVCMKHDWCDYNINCSPLQFCKVIKDAKYVVTTTFHGTIFSILNKKRFISILKTKKVEDLLNRLELSTKIIKTNDDYNSLAKKLNSEVDYDKVFNIIQNMKKNGLMELKNIL